MGEIFAITIDGPAGTGKSTVSKIISEKLNIINVETGAMYRAVTYKILQKNIKIADIDKICELLKNTNVKIIEGGNSQRTILDEKDVTDVLKSKEVSDKVSEVAAIPEVRYKLVEEQRKMAKEKSVIMEGRDIGSFVLPDAKYKFYLTASQEERAKRRFKDEKNTESSIKKVLENIKKRDNMDMTRKVAALVVPDGAVVIDTTNLTIDEVVNKILSYIKE